MIGFCHRLAETLASSRLGRVHVWRFRWVLQLKQTLQNEHGWPRDEMTTLYGRCLAFGRVLRQLVLCSARIELHFYFNTRTAACSFSRDHYTATLLRERMIWKGRSSLAAENVLHQHRFWPDGHGAEPKNFTRSRNDWLDISSPTRSS